MTETVRTLVEPEDNQPHRRILQIAPAGKGWRVVDFYVDPQGEGAVDGDDEEHVVCWALVDEGERQAVYPMTAGGEGAAARLRFGDCDEGVAVLRPGQKAEELQRIAKNWHEEARKTEVRLSEWRSRLIERVRALGGRLVAERGQLFVEAPAGAIDEDLLAELRADWYPLLQAAQGAGKSEGASSGA